MSVKQAMPLVNVTRPRMRGPSMASWASSQAFFHESLSGRHTKTQYRTPSRSVNGKLSLEGGQIIPTHGKEAHLPSSPRKVPKSLVEELLL